MATEVYRWVDEQGNVHFSDEPQDGAEKIEVGPIMTVPLPTVALPPSNTNKPHRAEKKYTVQIVSPDDNSAFHSGNGSVNVVVNLSPALQNRHQLSAMIDGQNVYTGKSTSFSVDSLNRGTHNLTVQIIDMGGNVVQSGPGVSFTVHRPIVRN
ncbi:hypothetical protein OLMES_0735 [Oleiphilus messinensis]|uniref:DUF4124 domain-containing protein n=2 Tax=Oleiphilus messinensis TaxID=141451 RepID=A0A1Y0I2Z1_9GAMM|nr:hypothetical protein OLMES_0735 [Oleiphilus messinensis]